MSCAGNMVFQLGLHGPASDESADFIPRPGAKGQQPQPQPLLLLLLPQPQPQLPQLPHSRNRMMMAMMIHQQQEEP